MEKRSRKYEYRMNVSMNEKMDYLKIIECKYHIIGINDDDVSPNIHGFIYFLNTKSLKSAIKILQTDNVIQTKEDSFILHEQISQMDDFWEEGELPKQSKPMKITDMSDNSMKMICNFIMKQNQQYFEESLNIKQQLINQNQTLIEENAKLKATILQQPPTPNLTQSSNILNSNNTNTNIKNSNNKTFNINVFLNEECKDAVTLMDFVRNLQIENDDLFYARDHGFAEAVSRILENGLKNYDIKTRPLHCTDAKRETMHIKEESGWVREKGSESKNIDKAIKCISKKKIDKITNYLNTDGKCNFASKKYEENVRMMQEITGGAAYPEQHHKSILKNLSKNIHLNFESSNDVIS